jgi:hypothetical protein
MKSDLEEAIESYEIEKAELEKQITEYVKEADYLYAHYYNRALKTINKLLQILKGFQNRMYSHISEQLRQIDNCRRMLADPTYSGNEYLKQHIIGCESKILEFEQTPVKPSYDSQEVDDALFNLANGDLDHFKLYFKSSPDVYLDFSLADQAIKIKIDYDLNVGVESSYVFSDVNKLKSLGFALNDSHWVYMYNLSRFKDSLEIKVVLARLIYDVFHYDGRFDKARIELS